MRLTERDKKFYQFLVDTRLPMKIVDVAKMFYPSESGNERSSIVVAQRRCRALIKSQYIECSERGFGESNIYYVGSLPQRSLRHRLTMSSVIAKISRSGFELLNVELEHRFGEKYSITSDLFLTCKYGQKEFYLVVEVDLTKDLNPNYRQLIEDIQQGVFRPDKQIRFLSVSDRKVQDEFLKKYFVNVKSDLSDFEKFMYSFIK